MKGKIIKIYWNDAHCSIEQINRPLKMVTIGYIVNKNSLGITLSNEIGESDEFRGPFNFIPRKCIIKVIEL